MYSFSSSHFPSIFSVLPALFLLRSNDTSRRPGTSLHTTRLAVYRLTIPVEDLCCRRGCTSADRRDDRLLHEDLPKHRRFEPAQDKNIVPASSFTTRVVQHCAILTVDVSAAPFCGQPQKTRHQRNCWFPPLASSSRELSLIRPTQRLSV